MIRRLAVVVAVLGVAGASFAFARPPAAPDLGLVAEPSRPSFLGCVGRVDRSSVSVLPIGSTIVGTVTASMVARGEVAASATVEVDQGGGAVLPLADLGASGVVGGLVELPTSEAGASLVVGGATGRMAIPCTERIVASGVAAGGSTLADEGLDLVLTNPYAVDAVVTVTSSSEVGPDSAEELASVIVPARTTVVRDLAILLPLRRVLSVTLAVDTGAVHGALLQRARGEQAAVEAVPPAPEWWAPAVAVPGLRRRVVVASTTPLDTAIRVDAYGPRGPVEGVIDGAIAPLAQTTFAMGELGDDVSGFSVSATNPVVVSVVLDGDARRAVSPAGDRTATDWVVPGSGPPPRSTIWVLNPTETEAEVVFQPLAPDAVVETLAVPPFSRGAFETGSPGSGYFVRSSTAVSVMWTSPGRNGIAFARGTPLDG